MIIEYSLELSKLCQVGIRLRKYWEHKRYSYIMRNDYIKKIMYLFEEMK